MDYDECLLSTYFDLESWLIALLGLGISFIFWRYGKKGFAMASSCTGLLLAVSWAYLYYELNCVELLSL